MGLCASALCAVCRQIPFQSYLFCCTDPLFVVPIPYLELLFSHDVQRLTIQVPCYLSLSSGFLLIFLFEFIKMNFITIVIFPLKNLIVVSVIIRIYKLCSKNHSLYYSQFLCPEKSQRKTFTASFRDIFSYFLHIIC